MEFLKLGDGEVTGRHGQHLGADGPGAANIQWRIANHQYFRSFYRAAQSFGAAMAGDGGDLVAILVVIGKTAEREFVP